ncbi:MAG: exonuclease domain-containing protein, partial [Bacteriovoracia bacterium]
MPKFVILDFETTGQTPGPHEIIEIGAVLVEGMLEVARYETLVRPHSPIPLEITRLTGITNEMVATAPRLEEVAAPFLEFLGDYPIVAHNNAFEQAFLDHFLKPLALDGKTFETHNTIDPIALVLPEAPSLSLENLRRRAGVDNRDAHRALKDSIDTLKVLEYVQDILKKERPQIARIALDTLGDGYWWHWFFNEAATQGGLDLTSAPGDELGDLKELRNEDKTKEIDWAVDLPESAIHETLQGADGKDGFQYREAQEVMSREIFTALTQGQKKAIEAPTGTGKSMAYLLPGYLVAEKTGAPLVVSTHSKSLQDQLLEKDIPRLGQILGREVHATAVKGQENYLCLRKLHELVDSLKENNFEGSTQEELWCTTYLLAYASVSPLVEVNRVSYYLRTLFPPFNSVLDQVRSHHSTTIGPKCPFYKRCHFFNSARKAHQSEVIVANHSLTFQWPAHLPQIRNIIFDEAHHLEDQITEAYTVEMTENAITELTRRLTRKSKNKRAKSELGLVASLFLNLKLSLEMSDRNHRDDLEALAKTIQDKLADVNARFVAHTKAAPASDWETIINLSMTPAARTQGLTDGLRGLHDAVKAMADYLGHAHRAIEQEKRRE